MASRIKSFNKEISSVITEAIGNIVQNYDVPAEFQKIIESKIVSALGNKTQASSGRSKKTGLLSIAQDGLNRGTKSRLEDTPALAQVQPLQELNNSKIKSLLQGLMGMGTLLRGSANITPAKPVTTPSQAATPLPTTSTTQTIQPVRVPGKKEEKDLIKDNEPQVVLIGGITNEGIGDLQKKLPVVLKDVLDELKKGIKDIKLPEVKMPPASTAASGGGLLGSLIDGGIVGTALDFFRRRKGTPAGNISRARKAKQLRAERATRKTAVSAPLRTAETPRPAIPKDGTQESKIARSARAKELRAERAALKTETGTTLKTAEGVATKEAGRVAAKGAGKTAAKGAGKALLKSGLKKIPGLGIIAGLGFGAQRALSGDWLGAAGEVASGAAGSIPGIGTAASVGIDTALAARDISKEMSSSEAPSDEIKEVVPPPVAPNETVQPFKESNQDLKPVDTSTPSTPPSTVTEAQSNPNKDILAKIAENTGSTNASIGALTQAIYKLAQSLGGKVGSPPIIVNGQQKQDVGPSASQVAAANNDPIRNIRSQFAV